MMKDPSAARKKRTASKSFLHLNSGANHSIGSRKVVDDSEEDEEVAPAKAPTPRAKPKSQSYVCPLRVYLVVIVINSVALQENRGSQR